MAYCCGRFQLSANSTTLWKCLVSERTVLTSPPPPSSPPSPPSSSSTGTTAHFGLWPDEQCPSIFPIYHQLSPSRSEHLHISLHFLFPSFPGSSPSSHAFQFLGENFFWVSYPPPFSPGDLTSLFFAPLSILLYFLLF